MTTPKNAMPITKEARFPMLNIGTLNRVSGMMASGVRRSTSRKAIKLTRLPAKRLMMVELFQA